MEIPIQAVLEGVITMMERAVLPELRTKYTRGQARAGIVLLNDLALRLEAMETCQAEELICLQGALAESARRLEEVKELRDDEALRALRETISGSLAENGAMSGKIRSLEALLEQVLVTLAEAERRHPGKAFEVLKELRRTIRRHLRKLFEARKRLSRPIELEQLSKAQ